MHNSSPYLPKLLAARGCDFKRRVIIIRGCRTITDAVLDFGVIVQLRRGVVHGSRQPDRSGSRPGKRGVVQHHLGDHQLTDLGDQQDDHDEDRHRQDKRQRLHAASLAAVHLSQTPPVPRGRSHRQHSAQRQHRRTQHDETGQAGDQDFSMHGASSQKERTADSRRNSSPSSLHNRRGYSTDRTSRSTSPSVRPGRGTESVGAACGLRY